MSTPHCGIIPPYMLGRLAEGDDELLAERARRTLNHDERLRQRRDPSVGSLRPSPGAKASPSGAKGPTTDDGSHPLRSVHDAGHTTTLPGALVRAEGAPAVSDVSANEAYDGLGDTWRLYHDVFARDSIDDHGLALVGSVHYDKDYDNAFWNGEQMVFGDGDGQIFGRFTVSVDVIGHELTHGVTQYTAALVYDGQSGALNESVSDVFGSLVKQYALGQDAKDADWLIGAGLLAPGIKGRALRDMLHPGTAYDDPQLGTDPQPSTMAGYVEGSDDNGGVHLNSGIPNRAFALAAVAIGGKAWEGAGQVWYDVLTGSKIQARCDFATFAQLTVEAAAERFGAGSSQATAVSQAWATVGVQPSATAKKPRRSTAGKTGSSSGGAGAGDASSGAAHDPATSVLLERSGGVAGVTKACHTTLGELPPSDAEHWSALLAGPELHGLAAEAVHPDAFHYRVCSPPVDLDVTVGEHQLSEPVRALFARTLAQAPDPGRGQQGEAGREH